MEAKAESRAGTALQEQAGLRKGRSAKKAPSGTPRAEAFTTAARDVFAVSRSEP